MSHPLFPDFSGDTLGTTNVSKWLCLRSWRQRFPRNVTLEKDCTLTETVLIKTVETQRWVVLHPSTFKGLRGIGYPGKCRVSYLRPFIVWW